MDMRDRKVIDELKELRLDLDLTYEALAAQLGVSRRNLIRILTSDGADMHDRTRRRIEKFVQAHHEPQAEATR